MTNSYIGDTHVWWLERLYRMKEKHRTSTPMPAGVFSELKALKCVTGSPAHSSLTAHGAGMLLTIRQDQAEARKQEKAAKRKKRR